MRRLLPLAALLVFSTAAIAQPAPEAPPPVGNGAPAHARRAPLRERFEAANTTHDGKLTLDQAQAAHMGGVVKHFGDIDSDHKGYVTLDDIHRWTVARRAARAGAGQMAAPPPPQ